MLPHVAFDKQIFLDELRALAEKYQDEPNPMPACVDVRRTIWDKLEVTPECKVDLEDSAVFESDRFVIKLYLFMYRRGCGHFLGPMLPTLNSYDTA